MNTTTLFILQLLGPLYLVVGLKMLLERESFHAMMKSLRQERGLSYSLGVILLVACTALILRHNIWEYSLTGLVTLLAWAGAIKGALLILCPKCIMQKWYYENNNFLIFAGVFTLAFGGFFVYMGFFA